MLATLMEVPDGWAKLGGEWVQIAERPETVFAAMRDQFRIVEAPGGRFADHNGYAVRARFAYVPKWERP